MLTSLCTRATATTTTVVVTSSHFLSLHFAPRLVNESPSRVHSAIWNAQLKVKQIQAQCTPVPVIQVKKIRKKILKVNKVHVTELSAAAVASNSCFLWCTKKHSSILHLASPDSYLLLLLLFSMYEFSGNLMPPWILVTMDRAPLLEAGKVEKTVSLGNGSCKLGDALSESRDFFLSLSLSLVLSISFSFFSPAVFCTTVCECMWVSILFSRPLFSRPTLSRWTLSLSLSLSLLLSFSFTFAPYCREKCM